jgi:hypothetical protein
METNLEVITRTNKPALFTTLFLTYVVGVTTAAPSSSWTKSKMGFLAS